MLRCSERTLFDEYEATKTRHRFWLNDYDRGGKPTKLLWTKIMELCPGKYVNHVVEQEETYKSSGYETIHCGWEPLIPVFEEKYNVKAYVTVYYDE